MSFPHDLPSRSPTASPPRTPLCYLSRLEETHLRGKKRTRENPADKNDVERQINHNRIVVRERLLIDAREQHAREHIHCQSQFVDARPPTHVGGWLLDTHVKSCDRVLGNNLRVWRQACL